MIVGGVITGVYWLVEPRIEAMFERIVNDTIGESVNRELETNITPLLEQLKTLHEAQKETSGDIRGVALQVGRLNKSVNYDPRDARDYINELRRVTDGYNRRLLEIENLVQPLVH